MEVYVYFGRLVGDGSMADALQLFHAGNFFNFNSFMCFVLIRLDLAPKQHL